MSEALARDTVYLNGIGCSGSLIRNGQGAPVGFNSAYHCLDEPSLADAVGNLRLPIDPVEVATGDRIDQMTPVNAADRLLLPTSANARYVDRAIGLFPGISPEEGLTHERNHNMSLQEIQALQAGDSVYASGWPVDQDNNLGPMRRQTFGMSVVGFDTLIDGYNGGKPQNILWAATASTPDGAECSFGASGKKAFVQQEVRGPDGTSTMQLRGIGNLARFSDLAGDTHGTPEQGQQARRYFEAKFKVDLSGMTTLCGFSYEALDAHNTDLISTAPAPAETPPLQEVPPVEETPPIEEVPPLTEDQLRDQGALAHAYDNFFDETAERTAIDGWVRLSTDRREAYVDNPFVFVDAENDRIILGEQAHGKSGLWLTVVRPGDTSVQVFDKDEIPGIGLLDLHGRLHFNDENGDEPGGEHGFIDENSVVFGASQLDLPEGIDLSKGYISYIIDGEFFVSPLPGQAEETPIAEPLPDEQLPAPVGS